MKCPKCKTGTLVKDHNGFGGLIGDAVKCQLCGWYAEKSAYYMDSALDSALIKE